VEMHEPPIAHPIWGRLSIVRARRDGYPGGRGEVLVSLLVCGARISRGLRQTYTRSTGGQMAGLDRNWTKSSQKFLGERGEASKQRGSARLLFGFGAFCMCGGGGAKGLAAISFPRSSTRLPSPRFMN